MNYKVETNANLTIQTKQQLIANNREAGLRSFIAGCREPLRSILEARQPTDLIEAYTISIEEQRDRPDLIQYANRNYGGNFNNNFNNLQRYNQSIVPRYNNFNSRKNYNNTRRGNFRQNSYANNLNNSNRYDNTNYGYNNQLPHNFTPNHNNRYQNSRYQNNQYQNNRYQNPTNSPEPMEVDHSTQQRHNISGNYLNSRNYRNHDQNTRNQRVRVEELFPNESDENFRSEASGPI